MFTKTSSLALAGLLFLNLSTATASTPTYRPVVPVPAIKSPSTLPRVPTYTPGTSTWRPNTVWPPIGSNPRTWSPYPLPPRTVWPPIGSDPRTWSPYPLPPNYQPWPSNSLNAWLPYYYFGFYPYIGLPGIPPNPYLPGSGQ